MKKVISVLGLSMLALVMMVGGAFAFPITNGWSEAGSWTSFPQGTTLGIFLTDGTNSALVWDGGAGDITSAAGAVTYSGTLGSWTVNVSTATSYPVLGSTTNPQLDLNSVNATSSAGGDLRIYATAGYFDTPASGLTLGVGGTTSGSVQFAAWECGADWPFHYDVEFGPSAIISGSPFTAMLNGTTFTWGYPYSLTIGAEIHHNGAGATSFDADLQVPEPTSLLLLGIGLLGIAGIRRKK